MVNEYRQTTAPVDIRLQGAQPGGVSTFCGPTFASVSNGEVGGGGSSWNIRLTFSTPKHSTPRIIRDIPMAKNNDRHMVFF